MDFEEKERCHSINIKTFPTSLQTLYSLHLTAPPFSMKLLQYSTCYSFHTYLIPLVHLRHVIILVPFSFLPMLLPFSVLQNNSVPSFLLCIFLYTFWATLNTSLLIPYFSSPFIPLVLAPSWQVPLLLNVSESIVQSISLN